MQPSLVELTTLAECEAETVALRHAVQHYFAGFARAGTRIFSLRQDGRRVLTLSAPRDGVVRHVVGMHNHPPTAQELAVLEPLLAEVGLQLAYAPGLMS